MKLPRWRRERREEELEAEIRSHLDMVIHDRLERGETAEQARENALREFGVEGCTRTEDRTGQALEAEATLKQAAWPALEVIPFW